MDSFRSRPVSSPAPLSGWLPARGPPPAWPDPVPLLAALELGLLGSAVGYLLSVRFIQRWGSTAASVNTYLQPLVGVAGPSPKLMIVCPSTGEGPSTFRLSYWPVLQVEATFKQSAYPEIWWSVAGL
jgi:hypothetical protein